MIYLENKVLMMVLRRTVMNPLSNYLYDDFQGKCYTMTLLDRVTIRT